MNADRTIREDEDAGAGGGASAPTIREDLTPGAPDGTAAATIRELADSTDADGGPQTVADSVESGSSEPGLNLVRGASFLGYRLTEPLKVVSGEADLWHLARQSDGKRFVLKLYRHGIRPKKEIVDAFHGLRFEHIVEVLERGAMDGRHYEVQEFIANGSLADLIERGPAADSMTRKIVRELANRSNIFMRGTSFIATSNRPTSWCEPGRRWTWC